MPCFLRLAVPALATCVALLPTMSGADPKLGVAGFVTEVGSDDGHADALMQLDTAITAVHGLQLDLGLTDYDPHAIGQVVSHLYMTPVQGQKYGVFLTLGDADESSRSYGALGLEGLFSILPNAVLNASGGLGYADPDSWDFVYVDAGVSHALGHGFRIDYGATVTEIDEPKLSDLGVEARFGVHYAPTGERWGAFAEARYDEIDDDEDTTLRAGISLTFGRGKGFEPKTRMFRAANSLGPLFRRGQL